MVTSSGAPKSPWEETGVVFVVLLVLVVFVVLVVGVTVVGAVNPGSVCVVETVVGVDGEVGDGMLIVVDTDVPDPESADAVWLHTELIAPRVLRPTTP